MSKGAKGSLRGARKDMSAIEAVKRIKDIRTEIDRVSKEIAFRIRELDRQTMGEPVTMYRNDAVIHKAISRIRDLYREGEEICVLCNLGERERRIFRTEPAIIRRLELSEEQLCPLLS